MMKQHMMHYIQSQQECDLHFIEDKNIMNELNEWFRIVECRRKNFVTLQS